MNAGACGKVVIPRPLHLPLARIHLAVAAGDTGAHLHFRGQLGAVYGGFRWFIAETATNGNEFLLACR